VTNSSKETTSSPQPELWEAETHWFHVLTELVQNMTIANMDGTTLKVYVVIKAHANYHDGQSFPGMDLIMKFAGVSQNTLDKCLKELVSIGLVVKSKRGRSNKYELREIVDIRHPETSETVAHASFKYVPRVMGEALQTLKNVILKDPNINSSGGIHIEKLNIFLTINEAGSNTKMSVADYIDQRQNSFPQNVEESPQA
jgi:hypothetical protein